MTYTRVDTHELRAALDLLVDLVAQANSVLDPMLAALTREERETTLRTPVRFAEAGRVMVAVAADAPDLAARARFDATAVAEDIENMSLLGPAIARLEALTRRLDDSRLLWAAEAYQPALRLYDLAKSCAAHDAKLDVIIKPLGEVFAARKAKPAAPVVDPPAPAPLSPALADPAF